MRHRSTLEVLVHVALSLIQHIDCNGDTVVQVRDLLKKRGFLRPTPASRSRNQRLPMFRIPDSPAIREKLKKEIFNPLANISHYVSSSKMYWAPAILNLHDGDYSLVSLNSMTFPRVCKQVQE